MKVVINSFKTIDEFEVHCTKMIPRLTRFKHSELRLNAKMAVFVKTDRDIFTLSFTQVPVKQMKTLLNRMDMFDVPVNELGYLEVTVTEEDVEEYPEYFSHSTSKVITSRDKHDYTIPCEAPFHTLVAKKAFFLEYLLKEGHLVAKAGVQTGGSYYHRLSKQYPKQLVSGYR